MFADRSPQKTNYQTFMQQYSHVVLVSGFRFKTVKKIWEDFEGAFCSWCPDVSPDEWDINKALELFQNKRKVLAIEKTGRKLWGKAFTEWWNKIQNDVDTALIEFEQLDYIGLVTKYHLARNLGYDCYKSDRWIKRVSKACGLSPDQLFAELKKETGDSYAIIDIIIWRACEQKVLVPQSMD